MKTLPIALTLILSLSNQALPGQEHTKPLIKDFMGINGHFHFRPELYKQVCTLVRNYHNMDWDVQAPGDSVTFPICVNQVNWKDHVYGPWVAAGFEVDICAQFGAFGRSNELYRELWQDNITWAHTYGRDMARYFGPSGEQRLCTSIEIGNEPGREFDDTLYTEIFTQMARGIRAGDPRIQIVTCTARVGPADKYHKSLPETFASPAMQELYDVINLHVYAIKPQQEGRSPWTRSFPEDPALDYLKTVDQAIAWRDTQARGKAVWITEFGWDACTDAALEKRSGWFAKLNWQDVTDLQQAQYLVRSFLCFCTRDVGRAYLYYYNDDDQASVHAASGITRDFQPKASFWALKHLYETLGSFRFARIATQEQDRLYIYEFTHGTESDRLIWVVWSPTGDGREQRMTLPALPAPLEKIERMPVNELASPNVPFQTLSTGSLSLTINESPVYILMSRL